MIATDPRSRQSGWRLLLQLAAAGNLVALAILAIFESDRLAIALGAIVLVGVGLRRTRLALAGGVVLAGVFADQSLYSVVTATSNALQGAGLRATVMPAIVATTALTGLVAAIGTIVRRHDPAAGTRSAPWVARAMSLLLVALLGTSILTATQAPGDVAPATISLDTANMAYSQSEVVVDRGEVTLEISNDDLFWHTFTVDELGVDVLVRENDIKRATFTAPPGIYQYYCAIPGHAALGMKGTLVVRDTPE